ncbi:hypothetical protein M3Y96_00183300 [Aphelenchoides besseyi]|nr:hypothetical protein M3Y96_00183300 [Aphelenchoides besseyi]
MFFQKAFLLCFLFFACAESGKPLRIQQKIDEDLVFALLLNTAYEQAFPYDLIVTTKKNSGNGNVTPDKVQELSTFSAGLDALVAKLIAAEKNATIKPTSPRPPITPPFPTPQPSGGSESSSLLSMASILKMLVLCVIVACILGAFLFCKWRSAAKRNFLFSQTDQMPIASQTNEA